MKTRLPNPAAADMPNDFPDADALAALRAWYEGASSRDAASRYLGGGRLGQGQSARGVISKIRRQLALYARHRQRADLATLFECQAHKRRHHARATTQAVETLRTLPLPTPQIGDDITRWLPDRAVRVLHAAGIRTLADLTVRIPRRRQWWSAVPEARPGQCKADRGILCRASSTHGARSRTDRRRPAVSRDAMGATPATA